MKQSGNAIDSECIYCKYSQFALKESNKVGLLHQQQALQQQASALPPTTSSSIALPQTASASDQAKKPDIRIEHLVKMFQSQLFKKSFITTSLLIIQRRMNDKYFIRQRNQRDASATNGTQSATP